MSDLSITSLLQPLNRARNENKSSKMEEPATYTPEKSAAFVLDLSDDAQQMMASSSNKTNKINSVIGNNKVDADEVSKALNRFLVSRNFDVSQKIEFSLDESGNIKITSDHPQKDEIEQALNDNDSLSSDIRQLLKQSHEEAIGEVQRKYSIELSEDENKDDEEKQLELYNKTISFNQQLDSAAGNFSFSGGKIIAAVTTMAASMSF